MLTDNIKILACCCNSIAYKMSFDQSVQQNEITFLWPCNLLLADKVTSIRLCLIKKKKWWYLHKGCQKDWTPSCLWDRKILCDFYSKGPFFFNHKGLLVHGLPPCFSNQICLSWFVNGVIIACVCRSCTVPMMDLYNWSQLALLSPSQCPAHFPLEG